MSQVITAQQVSFYYKNKQEPALKDVTFAINKGASVGLLGENGAGKTTLLSCLARQLTDFTGDISIFNEPISQLKNHILKIGYTPQELAIYQNISAYDNLNFFAEILELHDKSKSIEEVLKFVGLFDEKDQLVRTFSGGMKRRLNLAVSLLNQPDILMLDEPTVGVDPQTRNLIFERILELKNKNLTLIYSSHYMEEIERLCEYVIIIKKGKLLYQGLIKDLYNKMNENRLETCYLRLINE